MVIASPRALSFTSRFVFSVKSESVFLFPVQELAADSEKPVDASATNGNAAPAPAAGGDGKRKRPSSPSEPSTKKRKSDSEDVNVKEVDLKA